MEGALSTTRVPEGRFVVRVVVVGTDGWLAAGLEALLPTCPGTHFDGRVHSAEEVASASDVISIVSGMAGSQLHATVRRLSSHPGRVIVLTDQADRRKPGSAGLPEGVVLVDRSAPPHVLLELLKSWTADDPCTTPRSNGHPAVGLSGRERQVLFLAATGATAVNIASQLGIATNTVEDYVRRIRLKYQLAGRPAPTKLHLHMRAIEDGLVAPSRPRQPRRATA